MDKIKMTFKKEPRETGLASMIYPYPSTNIKVDGLVCGVILPPNNSAMSRREKWQVGFTVKDESSWRWLFLKKMLDTEPEAREFAKTVLPLIMKKYELHFFKG